MSSRQILLPFSVFALLSISTALICKHCNVDCEDLLDEVCLETGENQEVACVTEEFKDAQNITLYQRKCVIYRKNTQFECADYPGYTTVSCVTCKSDRCNRPPPAAVGRDSSSPSSNASDGSIQRINGTSADW